MRFTTRRGLGTLRNEKPRALEFHPRPNIAFCASDLGFAARPCFPRWVEHGSSRRTTRIEVSNAKPLQRWTGQDFQHAFPCALVRAPAHCVGLACWTGRLSTPADDASPGLAGPAATRAALLLTFWLMISGWGPADLPVGLAAVAGATWASLRLLPSKGPRFRLGPLAALVASFLRQSVVSGTDVAWRALNPTLKLKPGFVACPLRLPEGGERSAFCALSSLMPGTLPAGANDEDELLVHCLDVSQPVAANLKAEERLFIRAIGFD